LEIPDCGSIFAMSQNSIEYSPRRLITWSAAASSIVLISVFFYSLAQLEVPRKGLAEDSSNIPDSYHTPIKTFSPPQPPFRGGVILIHGYGGSKEMMQGIAADLAQEGFYTFCLDLPGCGDSEQNFAREKNQAAFESAYISLMSRALLSPNKVALIGHSMGGGLVLQFARDHAEVRATMALSAVPSKITPDAPRNLLLLTAENDLPGLKQAASRMWEAAGGSPNSGPVTIGDFSAGTARRAVTIPGANHLTILYSSAVREELRNWLREAFQIDNPKLPLAVRNWWIALAHTSAILFFIPLAFLVVAFYPPSSESVIVTGIRTQTFCGLWTICCLAACLLAAILPVRPWISIHIDDYVAWASLLGAAFLAAAGLALGIRVRFEEWSLLRPLVFSAGGFLWLYWGFGQVANSEWLHFNLSAGRWNAMGRLALMLAPLFFILELVLRDFTKRCGPVRAQLLSWLCYAILLAAILSPAIIGIRQVDGFLLMMSTPFLAAFFAIFSVLSAFLYQATRSVLCTAAWNAMLYAWLLTASLFWK
jgi:pimeloyl-ACP methyl ester carboxylesterase